MQSGVVIRELLPTDRALLAYTFHHLSSRSRQQRFLGPKRDLSAAELTRLLSIDDWHHCALIAFARMPRAPVGIARYVRLEDFDAAEVAIEVIDGWQRAGVGRALLSALCARATQRGIRRLRATMLSDNVGARRLAAEVGPSRAIVRGRGALELEIGLP